MASIQAITLALDTPDASGTVTATVGVQLGFTPREQAEALEYAVTVFLLRYQPDAIYLVHPSGIGPTEFSSIPMRPDDQMDYRTDIVAPTTAAHRAALVIPGGAVPTGQQLQAMASVVPEITGDREFSRAARMP